MELFLPDSPEALDAKIERRFSMRTDAGVLCASTLAEKSAELRQQVTGAASAVVVLTGHQPIFYPPGILIKDLLADSLAKRWKAFALNLVVDTDEERITFPYPDIKNGLPARSEIHLNKADHPLKMQKLHRGEKSRAGQAISGLEMKVSSIFSARMAQQVRPWLRLTRDIIETSGFVYEPGTALRTKWEEDNDLDLKTVYASSLVNTDAFGYFLEFIRTNASRFRAAYNHALADYRREHRIKNAAQPLPDLDESQKELPFWSVLGGRRIHLTETMDTRGAQIFPRAIALTLFCRLFLCDLFIHGRGGGRYDLITDKIFAEFFQCEAAPFTVASATLHLEPRADFALESRSYFEIQRDIRALQHDPTRFLDPSHPVRQAREKDLEMFRKEPARRPVIHPKLILYNEQARKDLTVFRMKLDRELIRSRRSAVNASVFQDRSFPFFFYDLSPLKSGVRPYLSRA